MAIYEIEKESQTVEAAWNLVQHTVASWKVEDGIVWSFLMIIWERNTFLSQSWGKTFYCKTKKKHLSHIMVPLLLSGLSSCFCSTSHINILV